MSKLCVYYTNSVNKNSEHVENHDRILISVKHLHKVLPQTISIYDSNLIFTYVQNEFSLFNKEDIAYILLKLKYSNHYLNKIKDISYDLDEYEIIKGDTYFSNVTYDEIIDNSIILYYMCHQICSNKIKYAYCLIRPPSHHANLNEYNGFCIVNHTYLTAKYLHDTDNKRVLILDYDVHHGDGTQALVNSNIDDNIFFVSMHCYGNGFYPGTGHVNENNECVRNVPLKRGINNDMYIESFNEEVIPFIDEKNADIIIVSNGLDAHKDDPFEVMKLTNEFYVYVAKYLKSLNKPLIYILEGGYNPDVIGSVSKDIIDTLTID